MQYKKAEKEHVTQIYQLVQDTIQAVYPKYYPQRIVSFFSELHSKEAIQADIESASVNVLLLDHRLIGTGTVKENHITRLFVYPEFHNNGYGSLIMQCLEKEIAVKYDTALLDASLCAVCFYEHKDYQTVSHHVIITEDGYSLVYDVMEKKLTSYVDASDKAKGVY
ncbi:MAG: GNAT family N-acetyltransferase [Erysipelotrichaceae bacterium]|nr:GNAT family N-acetyltransferase [Erysipelotrichaceae bacterium]